jgi:HK97 gp10 family phage protein
LFRLVVRIKIDGLSALRDALNSLVGNIPNAQAQALAHYAENIVMGAKQDVPVRTGALRDSITIFSLTSSSAELGSGLHYAGYVEKGASRVAAQPYLEPNVKKYLPIFQAELKAAIGSAVGGRGG